MRYVQPLNLDGQVKEAAQGTYQRAKEVDEEHKVVDKAKAGASRAWIRAKEVRVALKRACK